METWHELNELLVSLLLVSGGAFILLAAVGMVRMPDLFTRMQAATKAGTLGAGLTVLAVGLHYGELGVTTHALLVVAFMLLTAPVAAHIIARAAYFVGVPLWQGTVADDLRAHFEDRQGSTER